MRNHPNLGNIDMAKLRTQAARGTPAGIRPQRIAMVDGGQVRGIGGPTDDLNPRELSTGEAVLPADTVKAVGAHRIRKLIKATHTPVRPRLPIAPPQIGAQVAPARVPNRPTQVIGLPPADRGEINPPRRMISGMADGGIVGDPQSVPFGSSGWNHIRSLDTPLQTDRIMANGGVVRKQPIGMAGGGIVGTDDDGSTENWGGTMGKLIAGSVGSPGQPPSSLRPPLADVSATPGSYQRQDEPAGFPSLSTPPAPATSATAQPTSYETGGQPEGMPAQPGNPPVPGSNNPPAPTFAGSASGNIKGGRVSGQQNYTAEQLAQMGGTPPPGGMTTEQSNAYYGAMNRAGAAAEAQNSAQAMQHQDAMNTATQMKIQARLDAEKAGQSAWVNSGDLGERRRQLGIVAVNQPIAHMPLPTFAPPDLVGQEANVRAAGQQALGQIGGQQAIGQASQMNPLAVSGEQQRQAIGGIGLQQHQLELNLMNKVATAQTPEERAEALSAIMSLRGQTKVAIVDQDTGQRDVNGNPIYKKVAVNTATGAFLEPTGNVGRPAQALATQQAQAAIKAGAKRDDVNAQLKEWGYPPI